MSSNQHGTYSHINTRAPAGFAKFNHPILSIHHLPKKVLAVQNFPMPSIVKAMKEFLELYIGSCQPSPPLFYPLRFLKGKPKDLKWGPPQEAAFSMAKNSMTTAAALTFLVLHAPLLLSTDASDISIGTFP
ncbi:uncharacterized protein [Palaemon carinicauda]|uniref:uncharacterized protein n=1 Tax=Palaemon carinicauda TaxID=392227 RepID=UPI0035B68585